MSRTAAAAGVEPRPPSRRPSALSSAQASICKRIKEAVRSVEPEARIVLYGSRARREAASDSDWDLLILLDGPVDLAREKVIWHRLWALELELEEVLCPVVLSRQDWQSPRYRATPFHQNVERDGLAL